MRTAKQEELLERNKLERPNWTAEEFIATRILRELDASGAKGYMHLKTAIMSVFPECPTSTRWDIASFLLKRRIALNLVVRNPKLVGLPYQALPGKHSLAGFIKESPFQDQNIGGIGPNFFVARMPDDTCMIGYAVWELQRMADIEPRFTADKGSHQERIITQKLETFMGWVEFKSIAGELLL